MSSRLPVEYIALGLLMRRPEHGYELHREFETHFGSFWHCGRSQFYAALKGLEAAGMVETRTEPQDNRPARQVLYITPAGEEALRAWLHAPIPTMRRLRVEFMGKLRLFELLHEPGVESLIQGQIALCQERLSAIDAALAAMPAGGSEFDGLVYDFRRQNVRAIIAWLETCRAYFHEKEPSGQ